MATATAKEQALLGGKQAPDQQEMKAMVMRKFYNRSRNFEHGVKISASTTRKGTLPTCTRMSDQNEEAEWSKLKCG